MYRWAYGRDRTEKKILSDNGELANDKGVPGLKR